MRSYLIGGCASTLILLLTTSLFAQNFERYAPRFPDNSSGTPELPDAPAPAEGSKDVLVDELKGLVVVDHDDKVIADRTIDADGLEFNHDGGLTLVHSNGFHRIVNKYLGREVSLFSLNQLTREIIIFYRNNDQPVVDVSIPAQKISNGVIQVVITEAKIGKIRIENACFFDPCMLRNQVRCSWPGGTIYQSRLLSDLEWLNRNPFREVGMELEAGENPGETDIIFDVRDRRPVQVYAGYEDTGTRFTDLERNFYGLVLGNAFHRDDSISYQATGDFDWNNLQAHSAAYSRQLQNRTDTITIYGTYAEINGTVNPLFQSGGRAWQTSARYQRELEWCDDWDRFVGVGVDFKRTNSNLEFGGLRVFNTNVDIAQIALEYRAYKATNVSSTSFGMQAFLSPGGFSQFDNDNDYGQARLNATANYFYTRMYFEHLHRINDRLNFYAKFTGQLAEGNLLASEQLGFGGYDTVRGYDMRAVNGDSGYIGNIEIRTAPRSLFHHCQNIADGDQFSMHTFYDFGDSYNHTLLPGEQSGVDLGSVGLGVRYSYSRYLSLRADYGWQTVGILVQPQPRERVHLSVVASY